MLIAYDCIRFNNVTFHVFLPRFKLSIVLHSATVEKISGPGLVQAWPRELESIGKVWVKIAFKHWIGLRENLQETMVFAIKYGGFL